MKKFNLLLGIFLLLAFALFFVGDSNIVPTRSFKMAWNLGHIVFFSITILLLLRHASFLQQATQAKQFYWVVGICLVAGVLIESIQFFIGRHADWQDIFRNILGGLTALTFFPRPKSSTAQLLGLKFKVIITVLLCIQLLPLTMTLVDEYRAKSNFPMLADFENTLELSRWTSGGQMTLDKEITTHGNFSARIELTTDLYSGTSLKFLPSNWKNFKRLMFSVYVPNNSSLSITTRIHDQLHGQSSYLYNDRFQQRTDLKTGWNHITINLADIIHAPKTRLMDIESIANIGFFASKLKQSRVIYLDHLRLE
ncbi:MAG: VanZ family protein [Gammaproteobacteria bacterium]|jgi:VanZ family protein